MNFNCIAAEIIKDLDDFSIWTREYRNGEIEISNSRYSFWLFSNSFSLKIGKDCFIRPIDMEFFGKSADLILNKLQRLNIHLYENAISKERTETYKELYKVFPNCK